MLTSLENQLIEILERVLSLNGRSKDFQSQTKLLGSVAELDSLAVAALLSEIESVFAIRVEDDEIDGAIFATVKSLSEFIDRKLSPK